MKRAFGMFALTRSEQRAVILIVLALIAVALAKHYRDAGTIAPQQRINPEPQTATTPSANDAEPAPNGNRDD